MHIMLRFIHIGIVHKSDQKTKSMLRLHLQVDEKTLHAGWLVEAGLVLDSTPLFASCSICFKT